MVHYSSMLVALTVAGSDSIGGAGLEADLKAFASLGIHGACAVTAITSQNTQRVSAIFPVPTKHVLSQLDAILSDVRISSAKTGMLYSAEIARTVAGRLAEETFPIVVDPVMVAGVGDSLHKRDLIKAFEDRLLPIATIVTPNRFEAEVLAGIAIKDWEDAKKACRLIGKMGPKAVLLKGGHFDGAMATDLFFSKGRFNEISSPRLEFHVHGGGCTLSSFVAGYLAKDKTLKEAVVLAKERVFDSIALRNSIGRGIEVINPMATVERDVARYSVLARLKEEVDHAKSLLTSSWLPEVGTNFVFALPGATGIEQVCGLEGRIISVGGEPAQCGCLDFGASKHVATIVLTAMKFDPEMRSAINLRLSTDNLARLRSAGLSIGGFEREKEPKGRKTMEWGTAETIRALGFVPDVIFDKGGVGKEPMIRLLGKDPEDVLTKLRRVCDRVVER
ncbi:MAG: bifunctional hydroxymethylpyrimidine kinase/phosphomethylpyrimidine kinase [Methanomassiliicoccales archaeon]|nr:bifunctional hydroxymethylpyrimidine kinase/phosphomethylpyrimidine kinase [Methanomassiliicoccales archaeon]